MGFRDWSPNEVAQQIRLLGFGQYASEFQKNEIAGQHLELITEQHLQEMGIKSIGHRILLLHRFADIINGKLPTKPVGTRAVQEDRKIISSPMTKPQTKVREETERVVRQPLDRVKSESFVQVAQPKESDMIACSYCGRRLTPEAAKRHIPVCSRINQSRMNKKT